MTRRTAEIGVRMALGAARGSVLRRVLGRGLALTAAGLVVGLALAGLGGRALAALLYGVSAQDLATLLGVAAVLVAVAVLASWVPARRAWSSGRAPDCTTRRIAPPPCPIRPRSGQDARNRGARDRLPAERGVASLRRGVPFDSGDPVDRMPPPDTSSRTGPRPHSPGRPTRIFGDTPPEIEARVIDGYRAMSPADRLARVVSLNRALAALATARIRSHYGPDLSPRELRLRLASLRLPREDMMRIFDWDPVERGY